ncbi:hypothetical protein [Streptomyces coffeae]|uniref:Secreted protein n=1 Tax=Streptomyces coffeae TaxID=621382 RepID=A0ABS1NKH7_9ACTN|nr:hypothetical protein [Streptomyces coffeae]MBL1100578.1 hypothetical protein [Streptomyces coffeae]
MKRKILAVAALAGLTTLGAAQIAAAQDSTTGADASQCAQVATVNNTADADTMVITVEDQDGSILESTPDAAGPASVCLDAFPATENIRIHAHYTKNHNIVVDASSDLVPVQDAAGTWDYNGGTLVKTTA